jgi:hypothetical protein
MTDAELTAACAEVVANAPRSVPVFYGTVTGRLRNPPLHPNCRSEVGSPRDDRADALAYTYGDMRMTREVQDGDTYRQTFEMGWAVPRLLGIDLGEAERRVIAAMSTDEAAGLTQQLAQAASGGTLTAAELAASLENLRASVAVPRPVNRLGMEMYRANNYALQSLNADLFNPSDVAGDIGMVVSPPSPPEPVNPPQPTRGRKRVMR